MSDDSSIPDDDILAQVWADIEAGSKARARAALEREWPAPDLSDVGHAQAAYPQAMPWVIGGWAAMMARVHSLPVEFLATSALVACAGALGNRVALVANPHEPEFAVACNLWGLLVGPPSSGKSPTMSMAMAPLWKAQESMAMVNDAAYRAYVAESRARKKSDADGPAPRPPDELALVVNDITREALASLMSANPTGLVAYQDEILGLLADWDRPDRNRDRTFYMSAWNGLDAGMVHRRGRPSEFVSAMTLSLLGGAQFDGLRTYVRQAVTGWKNDGLLVRFSLLAYVPSVPVYVPQPRPTAEQEAEHRELREGYAALIHRLMALENTQDLPRMPVKNIIRPVLTFDDEAHGHYQEWRVETSEAMQGKSALEQALLGKQTMELPKLAALLHLILNIQSGGPIEPQVSMVMVHWARKLLAYYAEQHRALWGLARDSIGPGLASLLGVLTRPATKTLDPARFSARHVIKLNLAGLTTAAQVEKVLAEAVARKWIRPEEATNFYVANPRLVQG